MFVTLVHVHVIQEYINKFIDATVKNHEKSIMEPGNLRFDILQLEEDSGRFVLYEAYENEEASKAHKGTSHYLEWRETVANWMAEPRKGIRYNGIKP